MSRIEETLEKLHYHHDTAKTHLVDFIKLMEDSRIVLVDPDTIRNNNEIIKWCFDQNIVYIIKNSYDAGGVLKVYEFKNRDAARKFRNKWT